MSIYWSHEQFILSQLLRVLVHAQKHLCVYILTSYA